jgi:hypothetical protein
MAAPKGNQFWKLRSEHGRDYLFATPELLELEISAYFNWVDGHPWYKVEAVKSGDLAGSLIKVPYARPYTLSGLCIYLNASENYWKEFRKRDGLSDDFMAIISRTEEIIRTQKFEGAAVGAFNANIMARDLGLVDKTETKGTMLNINSEPLTAEKVRELEALKNREY